MTGIKNYKDLKDAVKLWLNRRDNATLDNIPLFIRFAEKQVTRMVQIPYYETTLSDTIGKTYSFVKIPQDLLKIKHVFVNGKPYNRADTETFMRMKNMNRPSDQKQPIEKDSPDWQLMSDQAGSTSSKEHFFSRVGDKIHFLPTAQEGDNIEIIYFRDIPEMINDEDQPYTLITAPDLMLYLSLRHASTFLRDREQEQYWMAKAQEAAETLNKIIEEAEWSGSALVVPFFGS